MITRGDRILLGLFPEEQNYIVPAGAQHKKIHIHSFVMHAHEGELYTVQVMRTSASFSTEHVPASIIENTKPLA